MANERGQDGGLILGGLLVGSPLVNGALLENDTTMDIDAVSLTGVVIIGDTFTLAGEAGSPTHTVTGGPFYVAAANAIASITFSTAIAAGGVANDAAVSFTANSVAEIRAWDLTAEIEMIQDTVKGDKHHTFKGGLAKWSGTASAWLDYLDTQQAALIDEIANDPPDGTIAGLMFQAASGKTWHGAAELRNFSTDSPEGTALQGVSFDFQGSGQVLPDWT